MRIVDAVFRQGHLSEQALAEAVMAGDRPVHLERCELCAERAVEMGRWLDSVRDAGLEAADQAFPAERLAAQHVQILRRLQQADEPARVIAFPHNAPTTDAERSRRRVAPGWVGVAAAAGLVIGVVGGQMSARLDTSAAAMAPVAPVAQTPVIESQPAASSQDSILDWEPVDRVTPGTLSLMDDATPMLMPIAVTASNQGH